MAQKIRHFTLVELLVVMGLIGLLVTLAVPSFLRLAKGKATPVAAESIKRQLEEAQALAISNRAYVGLVIPNRSTTYYGSVFTTDDTPDFNQNTRNQYYLASTRPALLFKDGSTYYFDHWAADSSWSKPIENARVVQMSVYRNELLSSGRLSNPAASVTASIASGALASGSYSFKSITTAGSTLGPCAVVFTPDGGLASSYDLYLAVAGCTVGSDGTITMTTGDTDFVVLHIDRMTGKVSYYRED